MTAPYWPDSEDHEPPEINVSKPHTARMYDYFLNGKTNFPADREAAENTLRLFPAARTAARANRDWGARAVRHLTKHGVRQFLDIGTGIPSPGNTHEVAQAVNPAARVVYADNDPIVLAHARALLTSHPDGRTAYIQGDFREPDTILNHPRLRETLDFTEPIALIVAALLHFVPDEQQPRDHLTMLCDTLPPGSRLVLSHATAELAPGVQDAAVQAYRARGIPVQLRTHAEVTTLFDGVGAELEDPGLVLVSDWHPDPGTTPPPPQDVSVYGGVARLTRPMPSPRAHTAAPAAAYAVPTGRTRR